MLLLNALRPALAASTQRRKYVINVTAGEGQFSRVKQLPGHPHTNMAKAALNMVVRTAASELFSRDRILLNAVDTGWITDERPYSACVHAWEECGWRAPLDLEDGAARVCNPIVRGEQGDDVYDVLLKNYRTATC